MFVILLESIVEMLKSDERLKSYGEKIDQWDTRKLFSYFLEVAKPMNCGFQVLNHGDCWLNNMFKSDGEGNPIDVSMIDYQLSCWATPSLDLLYFMTTSIADDIKVDHFDDLLKFYYEHLTSSLKILNFASYIPTLEELQDDLLDKGTFGWFL